MRDRDRPRSAAPLHHVCRAHPRCAGYGSRRRGGRGPGTPVWWRQLVVVGDRWTRHTQCGLRLRRWPGTAQSGMAFALGTAGMQQAVCTW
jgi:hypothetical protein